MRTKNFSISGNLILVGYLLISIILVGVISVWMLNHMHTIQDTAQKSNQKAALQEVQQAITRTLVSINEQTIKLENWNEIYQQLNNPVYYDYWRNNRSLSTDILSSYVKTIELYQPDGSTLRKGGRKNEFPDIIPSESSFIEMTNDKLSFYQFIPLFDQQQNKLKGHAGIRIDFIEAFHALNNFRYVDPESIRFNIDNNLSLPEEQLIKGIQFKSLPIPTAQELEEIMLITLLRIVIVLILLGIIAYYVIYHFFQKPLHRLSQHIDNFRRGKKYVTKKEADILGSFFIHEMEMLFNSFKNYQTDLDTMNTNLDQKDLELRRLSHHDPLTGIPNRRAYEEDWKQMTGLIQGQSIRISVMLFDCDHFKAINDTYGHTTGDAVIKAVAECLQLCQRKNDHLYRIGGNEFAMHMFNTEAEEAEKIALCCQQQTNNYPFKDLGIKEPIRFSIGLAHTSGSKTELLSNLHKQADIAMYHAKGPSTDKIAHYETGMETSASAIISSRYLHAVYNAIENGQGIKLHYQPIINFSSPKNSFCEVLARLEDKEGLIMPAHIFPVVNAEGLEVEFDIAILKQIKSEFDKNAIPENVRLSINLDGTSLTNPRIFELLKQLTPYLKKYRMILEVTETALITELHKVNKILTELRNDGYQVALDDFGSGYSSLRYLASMPVDIIKFDILMVRALESNDAQRQITVDIARMILSAGYELVAEGIEDETMLEKIRVLGFTHAQGFLLARPSTEIHPPESYTINQREEKT